MAASIKDVAREAGVSIATVSRVLNEIDVVNEDTKKKVLDAIKKLNYRPNIVARSLKTQKTKTIGIIIPDISSQVYSEIARGAEDVSNIYGYNVILCNTDLDTEKEMEYIKVLKEKMVDGIIYMSNSLEDGIVDLLKELSLPTVLVETSDKDNVFPSVTIDNEKAAFDAVEYLINKGDKLIAYIGTGEELSNACSERFEGYKKALEKNNIDIKDGLIRHCSLKAKDGYEAVSSMIKNKEKMDAIFCGSDEVAMGAINSLRDHNVKVPDDVDVMGFDNISAASLFYPKLTTVEQQMYDMGSVGMRMLIKIIGKKKLDNEHYILDHVLVERDSCKK